MGTFRLWIVSYTKTSAQSYLVLNEPDDLRKKQSNQFYENSIKVEEMINIRPLWSI